MVLPVSHLVEINERLDRCDTILRVVCISLIPEIIRNFEELGYAYRSHSTSYRGNFSYLYFYGTDVDLGFIITPQEGLNSNQPFIALKKWPNTARLSLKAETNAADVDYLFERAKRRNIFS